MNARAAHRDRRHGLPLSRCPVSRRVVGKRPRPAPRVPADSLIPPSSRGLLFRRPLRLRQHLHDAGRRHRGLRIRPPSIQHLRLDFRSVDLSHWLALDIASAAIDDAGFAQGKDLPRQTTGVLVGNTLTGEFSRANLMRVRWPYVRRTVEFALAGEKWDAPKRSKFLADLERQYKAPFPPGNEETLAGGLSNTIAGRICNYFDLKGGGYTVDGACASSLLAVINACSSSTAANLTSRWPAALTSASIPSNSSVSPAPALAERDMTVFDVRSQGFWPGEGCGFVALMRQDDAIRKDRANLRPIRGWGVSSDGAGGITRPEVEGQVLCLQRAYRDLEFKIADVAYFEGHGTGTAVGDATELQALATARQQAGASGHHAAIGSIKANIGHTKAAAGVAGMIKAAMAMHERVVAARDSCAQPHPQFSEPDSSLRGSPRRLGHGRKMNALSAGISAMGFGGINTHIVLQAEKTTNRRKLPIPAAQDCELFLFDAADPAALRDQLLHLRRFAEDLSRENFWMHPPLSPTNCPANRFAPPSSPPIPRPSPNASTCS